MRTSTGLAAAAAVVIAGVAVAVLTHEPLIELEAPDSGEVAAEWLPNGTPVFVTLRGNEVAVLDARVPRWLDEGIDVYAGFCQNWLSAWEPYYFSTFDRTGEWTGGPAPGGLASYEAELVDDRVRVGPRRPAPQRQDDAGERATPYQPCSGAWADADRVAQSHPPAVYHHQDDHDDAMAPEDLAGASRDDPALALGAVERVDAETVRACAWEPSHVIQGPLCGEDSPEVDSASFAFLDPDFDYPGVYGSYGLYLMTSEDGRLRVEGVLPEQLEYTDDARAGPEPPPDDE